MLRLIAETAVFFSILIHFPKFFHYFKVSTGHFITCKIYLRKVRRSSEKAKMKICNFGNIIYFMTKCILVEYTIFVDCKYIICFCIGPTLSKKKHLLVTSTGVFLVFTFYSLLLKSGCRVLWKKFFACTDRSIIILFSNSYG